MRIKNMNFANSILVLFLAFLGLHLHPRAAFCEDLSRALTPQDFVQSPIKKQNPSIVSLLKHPSVNALNWNLTFSQGQSFPRPSENDRESFIKEGYLAVGLTPQSVSVRSSERAFFSVLVDYELQEKLWLSGAVIAFDASSDRTYFSTFTSFNSEREALLESLIKVEQQVDQYFKSPPEKKLSAQPSSIPYLIVGSIIGAMFLLLIGYFVLKRRG